MKSFFNKLFQVVAVVGQGYVQYGDFLPAKIKVPVSMGIGIAQGVVSVIAHYYNPNGTKAQ